MKNSLLVKAFRGIKGERSPVWFMRQAGRFLPEYREIRCRHPMLDVIRTPSLAATVTLQPLERFDLDAAIVFADILNPLIGMGINIEFVEGEGPRIINPVRSIEDVERLKVPAPEENVSYTLEAIDIVCSKLNPRGIPLIGFSGAPFTLSCYMLGGKSSNSFADSRKFMLAEPEGWKMLQEKLVELVSDYLIAQAKAGAAAVQVFDSWAGALGPHEYQTYVLPYLNDIVARVKRSCIAPVCYFGTGTAGLLGSLPKIGADIYGLDWRISLSEAARQIGHDCPLQGNLDPLLLFAPLPYLEKQVSSILEEGRQLKSHVFNLGHGLMPDTPIDAVRRVVELVKAY